MEALEFSYEAGYPEKPWQIDVRVSNYGGTLHATVNKDGKLLMQLRKISGTWEQYGGVPTFRTDEISAVGDEIDNRMKKA